MREYIADYALVSAYDIFFALTMKFRVRIHDPDVFFYDIRETFRRLTQETSKEWINSAKSMVRRIDEQIEAFREEGARSDDELVARYFEQYE